MADVERMYVNGEWVLAQGWATFDVVNPADRSVVARVTNGAVPEVERAVTGSSGRTTPRATRTRSHSVQGVRPRAGGRP
jgi:acyl-CoA reductase-like NAD-dependent aldehyde dehydrogenase